MRDELRPIVTVVVISFNHERYIRRAIESILDQKTSSGSRFPLKILCVDDASSDKTQDIIREFASRYPETISYHFNKSNNGRSQQQAYEAQRRIQTAYFCILEADDYWVDDHKLLDQVDVLEANPTFVACGHDTLNEYEADENRREKFLPFELTRDVSTIREATRMAAAFHISSMVFRNVFMGSPPVCLADQYACEMTMYMVYAEKGDIYYLRERPMSIRAVHGSNSFAHQSREPMLIYHMKGFRRFNRHLGRRHEDDFAEAAITFGSIALRETSFGTASNGTLRGALYFVIEIARWRLSRWAKQWFRRPTASCIGFPEG